MRVWWGLEMWGSGGRGGAHSEAFRGIGVCWEGCVCICGRVTGGGVNVICLFVRWSYKSLCG